MFGHNFAGFAAATSRREWSRGARRNSSDTPAPLAKIEQRFGVPGPVLVAIWGQETSFGGDIGSFPTYSALATLAWDCRRSERFRAELIDAITLVDRGIVDAAARVARGLGGRGRPDAAHAIGLSHVRDHAGRIAGRRTSSTIPPMRSPRPRLSSRGMAGSRRGLERRRAQLRRHPAMELGGDLRKDSRAVRRPAGGKCEATVKRRAVQPTKASRAAPSAAAAEARSQRFRASAGKFLNRGRLEYRA